MYEELWEGVCIKIALFKAQKMVWILYGYSHSSAEKAEAKGGDMLNMWAEVRAAMCVIVRPAGGIEGNP